MTTSGLMWPCSTRTGVGTNSGPKSKPSCCPSVALSAERVLGRQAGRVRARQVGLRALPCKSAGVGSPPGSSEERGLAVELPAASTH